MGSCLSVPPIQQAQKKHIIPSFHLVWLDKNIDEQKQDFQNLISELRKVVNTIHTFTDVNECVEFINRIEDETAFIICSGALTETVVPLVQDKQQVGDIYIFCGNKQRYETLAKNWPKVKGVYTDIKPICQALRQSAKDCDHNTNSISYISSARDSSNEDQNRLDCTFMYTQILKEILLKIKFTDQDIKEFLEFSRAQLAGNIEQLKIVERVENEYSLHSPTWWYTFDGFMYSMVNNALRSMDTKIIVKMGFFIRDVHNDIQTLHDDQIKKQVFSQPFIVYRGQLLHVEVLDKIRQNPNGLFAFNFFLSTSRKSEVSLGFIREDPEKPNPPTLKRVLFVMHIDPSIAGTPYADLNGLSAVGGEWEILFSMHAVFRVGQIKPRPEYPNICQIEMTLTSDSDPELCALANKVREEIKASTEWHRLGQLLIRLAKFNQAEILYKHLLTETKNPNEIYFIYNQLAFIYDAQKKYDQALEYYEKSLKIIQKICPADHPNVGVLYNNIGSVYNNKGEYLKALEYFQKDLEISEKNLPENDPKLATSYNNIGLLYKNIGEHSKAVEYLEKSHRILKTTLSTNDLSLGNSYTTMGFLYDTIGEHSKAIESYNESLKIMTRILPQDHPVLATCYNNIGSAHVSAGDCEKAIEYFEKSIDIRRRTLPNDDPDLADSYNNIGIVYDRIGEYPKALEYYQKNVEISERRPPKNRSVLATSYNNIGLVLKNMGKHSEALDYYERSLEIKKETLPQNDLSLATSYNNIALMYDDNRNYKKAVEYVQQALQIRQQTLSENHPDLISTREFIDRLKTQTQNV